MVVIDASIWIARFKTDDKFHEQAKHIIQSLISTREKVCMPAIAFTEVAGVIKRITKDNAFASGVVLYMKDMEPKVFENFSELEPIATGMAIKHSIKGADAYYLAVAEVTKSHLYTFDEQQKEAFETMSKTW